MIFEILLKSIYYNRKIVTEKSYTYPFNPIFYMLLTVKSFKILPKKIDMVLFLNILLWIDICLYH